MMMMAGFPWEDDRAFSIGRDRIQPLDDIDGSYPSFDALILTSPMKCEPQWLDSCNKLENTSFDSGYTSSSQDIMNHQAVSLSIDPDFVQEQESPKKNCIRKSFAKIERGGRLSGVNTHLWSPVKFQQHDDFNALIFPNDFVFEPETCDLSDKLSSDTTEERDIQVVEESTNTKRKYTRRKPLKKDVKNGVKYDTKDQFKKPSKRLNHARNRFAAALIHADTVSKVRHQKHMESLENLKITKEQTAKAAYLLNRSTDSNTRKIRRVIFQENQKLQGDRFSWSVGDSLNKSFKHISVKKGLKRKRSVTPLQAKRQSLMDGSESD